MEQTVSNRAKMRGRIARSKGYKPELIPNVLGLIQAKLKERKLKEVNLSMNQSIKVVNGLKVLGVKCEGLQNFGTIIPNAVKLLHDQLSMIDNRVNPHIHYGISPCIPTQDTPQTHVYYIAIEVKDFDWIPDGLECIIVPPHKCAVIRKEREHGVGECYGEMNSYIANMNLQRVVTENPIAYQMEIFDESLETYYGRGKGVPEDSFTMDVCVPIY